MFRTRVRRLVAEGLEDRRLLTSAPDLVVDLQTTPAPTPFGLDPQGLTDVEGTAFFFEFKRRPTPTLRSGSTELWKLDGGTASVVKEFRPTREESFCCLPIAAASYQGKLFFTLQAATGMELWSSDGSEDGTELLMAFPELAPGGKTSPSLTVVGDQLFFDGQDIAHGRELWSTDGTSVGTRMVRDITPGSQGSSRSQTFATEAQLFFLLDEQAWWTSDGSAEGTVSVVEPRENVSLLGLGVLGNELFYTATGDDDVELRATDGIGDRRVGTFADVSETLIIDELLYLRANDKRLFVTDGTEQGTTLVRDFTNDGIDFGQMMAADGKLLFASSPTNQLWSSDGTRDGTAPLAPLPGSAQEIIGRTDDVAWFTVVDDGQEIWRTDGTAAGTLELAELVSDGRLVNAGVAVDERLFFGFDDGEGSAIWSSDGTLEGTSELFQRYEANEGSIDTTVFTIGDHLFFGARGDDGDGYWTSDGTADGTRLVLPREPNREVTGFFPQADQMFLVVDDEQLGQELWVTDGVSDARLVADLNPGPDGSDPRNIAQVGDRFFFEANRNELWVTDTTPAGTSLVTDQLTSITSFTDVGGTAFFAAAGENKGVELWKSDGTAAGTLLVEDIAFGEASTFPRNLQAVGDTLFFNLAMFDGTQIWKSDGTARGTLAVATIPAELVKATYQIDDNYVQVRTKSAGVEIWVSDGTQAGTEQVADLQGHLTESVQTANGKIALIVRDLDGRPSLWVSDGKAEGTQAVHTLGEGTVVLSVVPHDDDLYYAVLSRSLGGGNYTLWESDGTPSGSRIVSDLSAGDEDLLLNAQQFALAQNGDSLIFPAIDVQHGLELRRVSTATSAVGDLDGDGQVGFSDFLRFANNFGKEHDLIYSDGDLNLDGEIDLEDLIQLVRAYGVDFDE